MWRGARWCLRKYHGNLDQGGVTKNLDQGRADIFEIARDAEAGVFGERASVLDTPVVDYSQRTFSRKP